MTNGSGPRAAVLACGLVALAVAAAAVALPVLAAGTTDIAVTPENTTVPAGGTTTFDVIVTDADDGVTAMDARLTIRGDPGLIGEVEVHGDPTFLNTSREGVQTNSTAGGNTSVRRAVSVSIAAAGMKTPDSGRVTVATVTLHGTAPGGQGALTVSVDSLIDGSGEAYTVRDVDSGLVRTVGPVVAGAPATDPDGDGLYENVNGDAAFTMLDAGVFESELDSDAVESYPGLFDFNEDGVVNRADVTALESEAERVNDDGTTGNETDGGPTSTPTPAPGGPTPTASPGGPTPTDAGSDGTPTDKPPVSPDEDDVNGGSDGEPERERGFFTNGGDAPGPLSNALNLTVVGFLLSVIGIVYQMFRGR